MEKENKENRKSKRMISAKRMIIPSVIAMLIMHALIVLNTVRINNMGQVIAEATQRNFALAGMSNGYSQATDLLGTTALQYVNDGGEETLTAYFERFGEMRGTYAGMHELLVSGNEAETAVIPNPRLRADAAPENSAADQLDASVDAVMKRTQVEMTAMTLAARARGTDLEDWPQLKEIELPPEAETLPDEAKTARAREMLLNPEYQSTRANVQRNLSIAVSMSNNETAASIQRLSNILALYRMQQWVLMALIIGTMLVMIVLLFTRLIIPLEQSVAHVQKGESIPTEHGFSELRRLAQSYDELIDHRDKLEENLRGLSRTDALTGLPNRLAYQDYLEQLGRSREHRSLTVYSMDLDGLKETNDQRGHLFGDILLREAAACILKVFGDETGKNVFRTGGDEFVAFRPGSTDQEGKDALETFRREQERHGISISVGRAYTPDMKDAPLQTLFEQADRNMYEQKAARHRAEQNT